ncbi:hypothetical protein KVR01_004050 [Diaporthe batatas]|uniref:uncharacterized protein n=1 Tax=Diaporthe batatas TaxID=748121 RepID=UPI001D05673A|nr:uncharacterized protein KVR01_004050 [Diaporthe batatas]KAG8165498.1 hypothetical protein KVR01_004050 [Diaporthe batatas]
MMSHLAAEDGPDALSPDADAGAKANNAEGDAFDFEYEFVEEVEQLERYKPGGYHPVTLSDTLHEGRYRIISKLGHGTYSTSWMARDQGRNKYVAVKICTADSSGASHERAILRYLHQVRVDCQDERVVMVPTLLDEFHLDGPNGRHACIVTMPTRMSIPDTRETSRCYGLFHIPTARAIIAQLIHAVAFCHENGIVHGDLHLNNIMFRFPPSIYINSLSQDAFYETFGQPMTYPVKRLDGAPLRPGVPEQVMPGAWLGCASEKITLADCAISLADFGEAYMVTPQGQQQGPPECHTPQRLRPPEARFAPSELGPASDVWTLACAIFEIAGAQPLFFGSFFLTEDSVTEDWVDALGRLPDDWWARWDARAESFSEDGERLDHSDDDVRGSIEHRFEKRSQALRRKEGTDEWAAEETTALLGMLKAMLKYKPVERISLVEVLETEWMVNWGIPALEEVKKAQVDVVNSK